MLKLMFSVVLVRSRVHCYYPCLALARAALSLLFTLAAIYRKIVLMLAFLNKLLKQT